MGFTSMVGSAVPRVLFVDVGSGPAVPAVCVTACDSFAAAREALANDLAAVVLRVEMRGEVCVDFLREARHTCPTVDIVAFGAECSKLLLWEMRSAGLSSFVSLSGTMTPADVVARVAASVTTKHELERVARSLVGLHDLKAAQELLRHFMFQEALARAGANKRAIAKLLGVTRAAVQKIARNQPMQFGPVTDNGFAVTAAAGAAGLGPATKVALSS